MKYIKREKYLDLLKSMTNEQYVKILIGVRRSGKTSILNMHKEYLATTGVTQAQILHINFESVTFLHLTDGIQLHNEIEKRIVPNKKFYLFIDEVQEMKDWAKYINSLRVTFDIDIYVTGSNSNLFAGEHLTYLAGRYISIQIYPLSYTEMQLFKGEENVYHSFLEGSFPEIALIADPIKKKMMVEDVKISVFERDVILRGNIKNRALLNLVATFLFHSIGNTISFKKIKDTLGSNNRNTTINTIDSYVDLMTRAYLIFHCPRYDVQGKKLLKTNGKFYSVDVALARTISGESLGRGRELENFIFLELKKNGWDVFTLNVNRDYEIDFKAKRGINEIIYIQVAEYISNESVWERETRPFIYLNDIHPRYVVSFDEIMINSDKCKHINVIDFVTKFIV